MANNQSPGFHNKSNSGKLLENAMSTGGSKKKQGIMTNSQGKGDALEKRLAEQKREFFNMSPSQTIHQTK